MKNRISLMPSLWRKLAIFSVLIILVGNSLPSFFGQQEQILVTGLTTPDIKRLSPSAASLIDNAKDILVTETPAGQVAIQFTNDEHDTQQLHTAMKAQLEGHGEVILNQVSAAPLWLSAYTADPIKLGLDLNGGALFVLEVDTETALRERIQNMTQALQSRVREARILGTRVVADDTTGLSISFTASRAPAVNTIVQQFKSNYQGLTVAKQSVGNIQLRFTPAREQALVTQYVNQALTTMRSRIEQLGITEAVIQTQGKARIRIEIPGIKDLEKAERLIGATASLAFYQLAKHATDQPRFHLNSEKYGRFNLAARPIFTGSNISDAQMGRDEQGLPLVNLVLDNTGGAKMSSFTKDNIGNPIVTLFSEYVLDENGEMRKSESVINVARVQSQLGSRFSITNMASAEEAQELAMLLRAGSLEAPVSIVQKRIINASLGEQNVKNGMLALALGLAMTMGFMMLFYRRLGVVANIALVLNLCCLTGLMALTPNAVLTLPGIAGLVLTVGMAVDTNVLIFERIRLERDKGVPPATAMVLGYKNAWTTILDANVTTLICALVMLSIGYGPVKGFAIALSLGLVTSVFTGVAVSKTLSAYLGADWLLKGNGGAA